MIVSRIAALLCSTVAGLTVSLQPVLAQPTAQAGAPAAKPAIEDVVVTARRRVERQQKVPVAVTVLSQKTFEKTGAYTPQDLAADVPGLTVSALVGDRDNVIYNIRGQSYAYGTLFPAVITYFSEVPITQLSTGQFFDLSNVQVLRGPQGVLFGRVTDGGNVMLAPKKPSGQFDGYIETKVGDYGLHDFTGALNVPIIPDKVMVRGAFDIDRRDGFTTNIYNGKDLDNVAYESYRLGVTVRPFDGLENYTVVQYQHTHDNGTAAEIAGINSAALNASTNGLFPLFTSFGNVYGIDSNGNVVPYRNGLTPLSPASYLADVQQQVAHQQSLGPRQVDLTTPSYDRRDNLYLANTTTYDLNDNIQFKNIFGYVTVRDDEASNYAGANGALIETCHSGCPNGGGGLPFNSQQQFSDEFRLSGKLLDQKLTWSLGTYWDFQHPNEPFENDNINVGILQRVGVQDTQTYSKAGFGFLEYDASDAVPGLKFNGGLRYTEDIVKSSEATYVEPIPSPYALGELTALLPYVLQQQDGIPLNIGRQLAPGIAAATLNSQIPHGKCESFGTGGLFPSACTTYNANFNAVTWSGGVSYELSSNQLLYAKVSRGYRPGGVNGTAPPGTSPAYAPEYDRSVEVGFKGDWNIQGVSLRTNIAAYHDDYTNIQKNVTLEIGVPTSLVANVAAATIQGLEFEGTIVPFTGATVGFNYAYTDAQFDTSQPYNKTSCNRFAPVALGFCPFNLFSFTPKNQYTVTAHYTLPLDPNIGTIAVGGDYYYQSAVALDDTSVLNPDAIEPGYGVFNLDATWTQVYGRPIDLSAFITNVTDKLYRTGTDTLSANSSVGVIANIYSPPRMFGFGLKYRFGAGAR